MKFSELPEKYQEAICYNIHGKEMWELSDIGRDNLDALKPDEMFDAWLSYEGVIGYTAQIIAIYKLLFSTKEKP